MRGFFSVVCLLGTVAGVQAGTVPITSCGQVIPSRGELVGDLDCSGFDGVSVTVGRGLIMNGFTITGNPDHSVVVCTRSCTIYGPGTITGGFHGIDADDVDRGRKVRVLDLNVTGNAGMGVTGYSVLMKDSTVTNNGSVNGPTFEATGGVNSTSRAVVKSSTIENNLNFGVAASRVLLAGGTSVVNNGTNADCSASPSALSLGCADLALRPWKKHNYKVTSNSVCGTSQRLYSHALGENWGVCLND